MITSLRTKLLGRPMEGPVSREKRGNSRASTKRNAAVGPSVVPVNPGDIRGIPFPTELWIVVAQELGLPPQLQRVVELLLTGKENQEIAAAMQIEITTLRTYLSRIFERTGTNSRVQLVLYVVALANDLGVWSVRPSTEETIFAKDQATNERHQSDVIK
jgi:DNA-binding CsgD family transcriptional regulator